MLLLICMQEAWTTTAWMCYGDDGILKIRIHNNAHIQLEDVKNHYVVTTRLTGGRRTCVLVDIRGINYSISAEARNYSRAQCHTRIAKALVVASNLRRIAGIITSLFVKKECPVRFFCNETDAVQWLKTFTPTS